MFEQPARKLLDDDHDLPLDKLSILRTVAWCIGCKGGICSLIVFNVPPFIDDSNRVVDDLQ